MNPTAAEIEKGMHRAGTAWGVTPEDNCEAAKNQEAGKYAFCRAKAEAKAIKKGVAPDYSKCDTKLLDKWAKAEAKAIAKGTACIDAVTDTAIQSFVSAHTDAVATALDGGTLPADVATCNSDLSTCQGDLSTCGDDVSSCNADLGTCNGSLATCAGDLGTAQADLTTCNGDLGTCQTDLTQSQSDLTACDGDFTTCTGDLGTCNGDLATCNAALGTCPTDLAACLAAPQGQRVRTGQTQCWNSSNVLTPCAGTGQDGDTLTGLTVSFTDNGDGTITDNRTGLMWEKLSDDGSIHDKDTTYTWHTAGTKITALNGGGGFAGHTDWRLPNINELQSLANYGTFSPAVHAPFHTGCVAACTVLTCSCTQSSNYWSATTLQSLPHTAWFVNFNIGSVNFSGKTSSDFVRAVRSGS